MKKHRMDFAQLKKKALELKEKAVEFTDKTLEQTALKVAQSSLVLKDQSELETLIKKSENKQFITQEGQEKTFIKRSYLVVWDSTQNFYKEFLFQLPVFLTKTFSQNVVFKMADIKNEKISFETFAIPQTPALLVFENTSLYKMILWEDNVKKVVNSLELDINKTVDEM